MFRSKSPIFNGIYFQASIYKFAAYVNVKKIMSITVEENFLKDDGKRPILRKWGGGTS